MELKRLREERGIQQKTLAILMGVKQPAVAAWENGRAYPAAEKLPKLAGILGCSIDALFFGLTSGTRAGD